jgi:Protein of unknown function (DUF4236)
MPLRFSRRIKLLPGLRLNVSKSGVSASFGTRGAWVTVGKRGTRTTVGLPGTGLSYTTTSRRHDSEPQLEPESVSEPPRPESPSVLRIVAGVFIFVVVLMAGAILLSLVSR